MYMSACVFVHHLKRQKQQHPTDTEKYCVATRVAPLDGKSPRNLPSKDRQLLLYMVDEIIDTCWGFRSRRPLLPQILVLLRV